MRGIWKHNITVCLMALLVAMTGNSYAGNVEVKLPTNSAFQVISGAQPLMHVGSNGKVGIGTTSPEELLHLYKPAGINQTSTLKIESDGSALGNAGKAKLQLDGGISTLDNAFGSVEFMNHGVLKGQLYAKSMGDSDSGHILMQVADTNGSFPSNYILAIDGSNNGNVGIGTMSPAYKLHVDGLFAAKGLVKILNPGGGSVEGGELQLVDSDYDGSTGTFVIDNYGGSDSSRWLRILYGPTGQGIFMKTNGNVGIGTDIPSYKLHVNGTAAGTSWTNLSSREFKEDINVVGESEHPLMLAKLMEMDLSRYRYKKEYGGDGDAKLGFIAEEMPKEVLSKDGKGVDVYELLTFTIGAMKAQQKEIETQRQYNKALEDRLAALEKLLEGK